MRKSMKDSLRETIQGLSNLGVETTFTKKELNELGVKFPVVQVTPKKIKKIRKTINLSQSIFAELLNVSLSSVRQWELGLRTPTGSTQVLLELLSKEPHALDFRFSNGKRLQ